MRCPVCDTSLKLVLIEDRQPDLAESTERRDAWAAAEDEALLREAQAGAGSEE